MPIDENETSYTDMPLRTSQTKLGLDRLVRTLSTIGDLSEADKAAIQSLRGKIRELKAGQDIVSEGDRPEAIAIIVSGFACRYKMLRDGRRQIVSFHIAGDAADIQSLHIERMDHSLGTLEDTTVLHISHEAILEVFKRSPNLAALFWRSTLIDASIFREWVLNVGQRDAYERTAHVLCELMTRMKAIGLADERTCEFPLTQAELADTTGVSPVHANRTLQALRANNLIELKAGKLTVLDWDGLKEAGGFDDAYLHLRANAA